MRTAVSESSILFPGQTEVPDADKVNATWVFEKRDGQWLIAAYHNSPVQAPCVVVRSATMARIGGRAIDERAPDRGDRKYSEHEHRATVGL